MGMEIKNVSDEHIRCPDCRAPLGVKEFDVDDYPTSYRCPKCHELWEIKRTY